MLFVILSNFLVTASYIILARLSGIRMGELDLGLIFFVTNVMNHLVRSGGVAGFSLRYIMMKSHGVSLNDVLNSSLIHFLLGSLIMLGMLPLMILYILASSPVSGVMTPLLIFLALIGVLMGLGVISILFSERLRLSIARLVVWLGKKVGRRDITPVVDDYSQRAAWMVSALRRDRKGFTLVMLLLVGEWIANVIVLNYCLKAFGSAISFGGTAAIYVIATTAGGITSLPGGIGVQEALFTSLAVMQGSSFEQALLAALLYRIMLTFLPYLFSFALYPRLLKMESREGMTSDT